MWIVIGDLDQIFDSNLPEKHRLQLQMDCNLALNALTFLRSGHSTKGLRIGFVYNPLKLTKEETSTNHWLTRVLYLVGNPINITSPLSNQLNNEIIAKRKYAEQMSGRNFAIRLIKEMLESIKTSKSIKSLEELLVSVSLFYFRLLSLFPLLFYG